MSSSVELDRLVVKLVGDSRDYTKVLKRAEKQALRTTGIINRSGTQSTAKFSKGLMNITSGLESVGAGVTSLGRKMTLFVTGPLALFAGFSVKSFSDFDDAMTKSTAIMDGVTDEVRKNMEEVALSLSAETITAPRELAESYFFLASAGMDAQQSMASLSTVNDFAIAGAFDMATATDLLTDAQQAMGLASDDNAENLANLTRVADVFVKANTSANTSVQQIAEAMTADAGTAALGFGASLETTVAVLDAYASAGKKGAEAGNLFGRATRLLTKAARKHGDVFEEHGIKVIDDATGEYRNFIDIIADMEVAFEGMPKPVRDATLAQLGFKALAQKSITPLLGLSGAMKEYEAASNSATGFSKKVAGEQMKSFAAQMKNLKNQIEIAGIAIGKVLAPWILWLGSKVEIVVTWFTKLNETTQKWIVGISLGVAALGPLLLIVGSVLTAIGSLVGVVAGLVFLGPAFVGTAVAIIAGLGALTGAVATVTAAVAGLIFWLVGKDGLMNAWTSSVAFAKNAFFTIIGFLANFRANMGILYEWVAANWKNILNDMVQLFIRYVANTISNAFTAIKTMIRLWVAWKGFMAGIFEFVFSKTFVNMIKRGMVQAGKLFMSFAKTAMKTLIDIFTGQDASATMGGFLSQLGEDFAGGKKDFLGTAKNILKEGLSDLKGPIEGFESSISEAPKFLFDTGKEAAEELGKGITKGEGGVTKAVEDISKKVKKTINIKLGVEGVEAGSAEALAKLDAFQQSIGITPGGIPKPKPAIADPGIRMTGTNRFEQPDLKDKGGDDIEALLQIIAENTQTDADRPIVVLEEANIA